MPQGEDIQAIAREFRIDGDCAGVAPHGSGHIHDTFRVTLRPGGALSEVLLQRINDRVFRDPAALMENILRVTSHLQAKFHDHPDRERRCLTVIPARDGAPVHRDRQGGWWRAFRMIERVHSHDLVQTPAQAREAARAFGQFQHLLADLPSPPLHDTIPDFHHTAKRFDALVQAAAADRMNRAGGAKAEIEFALRRQALTRVLLDAGLPERVTHNDTKLNNVLLDDATGEAVCVIDLDTVMRGLALHDFGDLVRTSTSPAPEDERNLARVVLRMPYFEALVRGYLETVGSFLTASERRHLVVSGRLITFEIGLRFLTDYLDGDVYYKTNREGQNLDRCRTQFRLVESMETQEDEMQNLVDSLSAI